jgi:RNA polymerase sigma factor (sigma-70 family)
VHRDGREEAYARQIIVRASIDEHRRPWHRERPTDEVPDSAAPAPTSVEDRDELISALQQLTPMQRNAVVLRHWLGLSVRDTAAELGIAEGSVKSHTSRGLDRLSALLGEPAET